MELTDLQISQAIHEYQGKCWHKKKPSHHYSTTCEKCGARIEQSHQTGFDRNPNYCGDWHSIAAVEKALISSDYVNYAKSLDEVLNFSTGSIYRIAINVISASPRERAIACLLAMTNRLKNADASETHSSAG